MVLPTKRLHQSRALLSVGGEVLRGLDQPKTISRLWAETSGRYRSTPGAPTLTYDWFILALTLLYAVNAIEADRGLLSKRSS